MKTDKLKELYLKYELTPEDVFKHQHYTILLDKVLTKSKLKSKSM
jgi:hypothetical protein